MEKLSIGKGIFTVSGAITRKSDYQTDANVGDFYKYIYIGDHVISRTIIPHPLQIYLSSDRPQEFFMTKIRGTHIITAVRTADGMKYATPLGKVGKWHGIVKVIPVLLMLMSLTTCMSTGGRSPVGAWPMITLIVLTVVLTVLAARSFGAANRAFRQVDKNVTLLKPKFGV